MIITLRGANFSSNNINDMLDSYFITVQGSNLTHNLVDSVDKETNSGVSGTITINDGYVFDDSRTLVVKMGTQTLSGVANIAEDGKSITINISQKITGNVVITVPTKNTATGEETNPEAGGTETVTLVFTEGTLDSQSGNDKTATGTYRTDHVAVDANSVIRFSSAKTMIVFKYDSNKTYIGRDASDWYSSSEVSVSDAAYIRILVKDVTSPPTDGTVTRAGSSSGGNGGSSSGSEDLGNTTFGSSNTPVTIISDFSDFTFEDGKVVSTSSGSSCNFGIGTARATSTTQILKVSGGDTVTFTPTISGLQYALIEFTDAPCTLSTLNKSGFYGQGWVSTTSSTLHADTKYLTINFNRGSGNFTASELEALKNAIKLS